jgi:glycosyltransferase involved in cell wall biosynthesis
MNHTDAASVTRAPGPSRGEPLRIAFVTETFLPRIDGTVTRLCNTLRHLREFGHSVMIVAPEGGVSDYQGARVHGVPAFAFPLYPELKLGLPGGSVEKALAAFRPDLIHAVHPVVLGIAAFHYSSEYRVPLVVSYHCQLPKWLHYYGVGPLEPLLWWGIKAAYNRADLVLATSRAIQALLQERGVQRVDLWQRGVDTDFFHPQKASQQMRALLTQGHPDEHLLLYVGRLSAEKNIEQCRTVLEALPETRLALVGDGPHRAKLERHFAGTPTYFAGYMRGEQLAAAFASADVFLLPSRTETLGLVLLEAMASGCPVVAAAEGGVLDIVQSGSTGYLYDPDEPLGAISAVSQLLSDSTHRERVRLQARQDVEEWGWASATRQLERFYRIVLERERRLPRQLSKPGPQRGSIDEICRRLQISRATFRRHVRPGAIPATN